MTIELRTGKPGFDKSVETRMSGFQRLGLGVALAFYLTSVIWVFFIRQGATTLDPDTTVLTLAHWQLEDGFRGGIAKGLREFERLKAEQGVKVKIIQTPIPFRGYTQWMLTQLVGGNPADLLEITGAANIRYQYFRPLSPYLGSPNPYNKGTPLDGVPWKDTYIDGMSGAFNEVYADYFGIPMSFFTLRLHVNVDLVEKATGSRKLPENLTEWIEICRKIRDYGEKVQQPISPIGVRGFDKATLFQLYSNYYSQTNGHLIDNNSRYCDAYMRPADILIGLREGTISRERQTAAADIVTELGQYFVKGFQAIDLEQAKYLFYAGQMAFFPEGTWNSWSMVQNSPFEVAIIRIPPIGDNHRASKYFTGKLSESGEETCVSFGIPKACKHFDLALEALEFLSSYETNQMVNREAKWGPGVRFANYEGLLSAFEPDLEGNLKFQEFPFFVAGEGSDSYYSMLQNMEVMIIEESENPGERFMEHFRKSKSALVEMQEQVLKQSERANVEREMQRSQVSVGLLRGDLDDAERNRLELRRSLGTESLTEVVAKFYVAELLMKELKKLKKP